MQAEQASIRLDAVLKATGHSAGLTKRELDDLADSMAGSTQFDDETLRNAEAQLLKFGNIHGETFREALKLSADLAAFMGTDLNSAVQSVGKALTAPAEGTGALEKQIGKFNPAAKQMIEALDASGESVKAQAAVLDLLRGKIGGAAEALNSGLTKASNDAKKSWDEMLESVGKTAAFQKAATSGIGAVTSEFRRMKEVIENGTWTEKALALFAMGNPIARTVGWEPKLTPSAPPAVNETSGRIGGVAPGEPPLRTMLTKDELKDFNRQAAEREKRAAEAKRLGEEHLREAEKVARAEVELEEMAAEDSREAWDHWGKIQMAEERERLEGQKQMWRNVFETIDREQEQAIEDGQILMDAIEKDAKDASNAARELGLTFTSAFEDAVIEGKKFSDVLQGLGKDVGRIILRKGVTEPLAKGIGGMIEGIDFGKIFGGGGSGSSGAFGIGVAGFADGTDFVPRDGLAFLHKGEAVVPAFENDRDRGAPAAGPVFNVDMRGASVEAVMRLERLVHQVNGSIESRALGAVRSGRARGLF